MYQTHTYTAQLNFLPLVGVQFVATMVTAQCALQHNFYKNLYENQGSKINETTTLCAYAQLNQVPDQ